MEYFILSLGKTAINAFVSEDWYIQAYVPTHKVPSAESAQGAGLLELHVDDVVVMMMVVINM